MARLNPSPTTPEHDPVEQLVGAVVDDVRAVLGSEPHDGVRLAQLAHVSINAHAPMLDHRMRQSVHTRVLALLSGLGVLSTYLSDPSVSEVTVNAGSQIWVDRTGQMEWAGSIGPDELHGLIERILVPLGLRFDRTTPIVDARLPNGQRLCAVLEPLAVDGTCLSIRQFSLQNVDIAAFAPPEVCSLVRHLVATRANVVVSGGTSSGKTTLLNAIGALVPAGDRIITIEDTAELLLGTPHVVRLEARPATPDGDAAVTVRDLLRAALELAGVQRQGDRRAGSATHLVLQRGEIPAGGETLVRVHEPLSVLDFLDPASKRQSFSIDEAQAALAQFGHGVIVLMHRPEDGDALLARLTGPAENAPKQQVKWDPRTYGIGAQILRDLGVTKMRLLSSPRKMPSMTGFDLEVTGFVTSIADL